MPLITSTSAALDVTTIAKLPKLALDVPSLTPMVMFGYVPTCAGLGVPDNTPVEVLKVAQLGRLLIENASALPAGSLAFG